MGEQVAARRTIAPRGGCKDPERAGARMLGRPARRIDGEQLAEVRRRVGGNGGGHRLCRGGAGGQPIQHDRAECGVGDVLRGNRPCPGAGMGAPGGDRR